MIGNNTLPITDFQQLRITKSLEVLLILVELLTVKHLVSENICSYHRENIMWYNAGGVEAYYGSK
jgi:hypothetical protein